MGGLASPSSGGGVVGSVGPGSVGVGSGSGDGGGVVGVGSGGAEVVGVGSGRVEGGSLGPPGWGSGRGPGPGGLGAVPKPSMWTTAPTGAIATCARQGPEGSRRWSTYTLIVNDSPGRSVPDDWLR
ncbi:hypothetical protein SVIOM74S_02149 [Streptomyces violarus]